MAGRAFLDAVTINHFASVGELDLLRKCCRAFDRPMWVEEVYDELMDEANPFREVVKTGCTWMGEPQRPDVADLTPISRLQVGLNDGVRPPTKHAGEAQSIYFSELSGGVFVTDDGGAFDFAQRRFGMGRVLDSIDLLRRAVVMGDISAAGAANLANAVVDSGRYFRRSRAMTFASVDFEPT